MIKIVKAKDCMPDKSELVFDWLIQDKANKAKGFYGNGMRFFISVYQHSFGFYVATGLYTSGRVIPELDGLILSKDKVLDWLRNSLAEIPKPAKVSLTGSFREMVRNTQTELRDRHTSEFTAFMA